MCGINAIFAYGRAAPPVDPAELVRVRDRMVARGPDAAGAWLDDDGRVGLGHRRLAIIDVSPSGSQPMVSPDGALAIVFNGEIYNYRALRARLAQEGCRFVSHSDTEVLLHLYARYGARMVDHLRGMYAFALWDATSGGMLLARDPYGIKPLYLADDGRTLRVASQVKALLAGAGVDDAPDAAGHAGFFILGYVPEPHTLFRGIVALPAGSTLWVDGNGPRRPAPFFDLAALLHEAEEGPPPAPMGEALRAALDDTMRHHLVADVPVGLFLSAGLDSATLAALAWETHGAGVRSITLAFDEYHGTEQDEAPLAEAIAQHYDTDHQTRRIGRVAFEAAADHLWAAMDQPSIDGVNSYFVARATAEAGLKVALSGLGGDELFGGYASFRQVPRLAFLARPLAAIPQLGRAARRLAAPLIGRVTSPKLAGLAEYGGTLGGAYLLRRALFMPWELGQVMDGAMARDGIEALDLPAAIAASADGIARSHPRMIALESQWYMRNQLLRDADWAGMAHSLEIRVPLVDASLVQALAPLLACRHPAGKRDMAAAPLRPLPETVLTRRKTGFAVPVRDWIGGAGTQARGLRGWAQVVMREYLRSAQDARAAARGA